MYRFDQVAMATTPMVLAAVAEAEPGRQFVIADDGESTYQQMASSAARLSRQLTALGLHKGDHVGILLPNGVRWCASLLGAHAAGLTVVPLNTWYRANELVPVAHRARIHAIITQDDLFGADSRDHAVVAGEALDSIEYRGTFVWSPGDEAPSGLPSVPVPDALGTLRASPVAESDDALLLFTSGSSAEPKAVRLLHGGMIRTGHAVGERQGVTALDRFWFASPLFFVFGCANALPNALTHGATLCLQERFEAASALEFIERHRCTVYYAVAPMTRAMAASEELTKRDISSLRTGTANATREDLRLAIEVLGVEQVCNAYGMTEGYGHSTITSCADPPEVRMASQGRVLATQQLRIVGDDGDQVPPNEPGHIEIRGTITPGYLDEPGSDISPFNAEGWFCTGDVGFLDDNGRLHYVGRSHEMMKVKGINISPAEVELLLVGHEAVNEAFVFGLGDSTGDQEVACVLVSNVPPSESEALAQQVGEWMRQRAASYKTPTRIRVVTAGALPLTSTGKVSKRLLKEQMEA